MPDITIRDVPQEELEALHSRAERHGRSPEAELLHIIHEAAGEEMLVLELERANRAAEATIEAVKREPRPPASTTAPRRRSRSFEPTPNRR